jgi:hypothetical protein
VDTTPHPAPRSRARKTNVSNEAFVFSRAQLGLPPDPQMVRWYFQNRLRANYETGFSREQLAANDKLWAYICAHDGPPPADWMARNMTIAAPKRVSELVSLRSENNSETAAETAAVAAETAAVAAETAAIAEPPKPARSTRAAYWRDQKRRKRAASASGAR